jgi:hypothetical protein
MQHTWPTPPSKLVFSHAASPSASRFSRSHSAMLSGLLYLAGACTAAMNSSRTPGSWHGMSFDVEEDGLHAASSFGQLALNLCIGCLVVKVHPQLVEFSRLIPGSTSAHCSSQRHHEPQRLQSTAQHRAFRPMSP